MDKYKIEIKWALIFIVVQLLWMVMEKITGFHDVHIDKHYIVTNLFSIPAITIFVFALVDKRRNYYQNVMSYKQGFFTGFRITLIVTIFTPLIQYIISTIISPDYFENISAYAVSQGKMTSSETAAEFNLRSYMIKATIGAFIMGNITSALVAIFTKRKKRKEIKGEVVI